MKNFLMVGDVQKLVTTHMIATMTANRVKICFLGCLCDPCILEMWFWLSDSRISGVWKI
jgi:hypothetical protein